MAPCTAGGLAGGMARDDHIHRENYGFIGAKGPAPASAFSHSLDLHLRNLGPVAHGGHTPRTTHRGCIPEYTYQEGVVPSPVASRGQVSHLKNQRTMAHDKLAQGMASTSHILLGNHAVNHTKGLAPASTLGCGLDLYLGNLGPATYGGRSLENYPQGLHSRAHLRRGPRALSHH
jgi:hypothetical protein